MISMFLLETPIFFHLRLFSRVPPNYLRGAEDTTGPSVDVCVVNLCVCVCVHLAIFLSVLNLAVAYALLC